MTASGTPAPEEPAPGATGLGGLARRSYLRALAAIERLSPVTAAYIDWVVPPNHRSWGGPMNGQPGRRRLVREISGRVNLRAAIETGTFRGTTTQFLWDVTGAPVWTAEANRRFAAFARWRFTGIADVTVREMDSRAFLEELASDADIPKRDVLFYLDAHWHEDLPLASELETVLAAWEDPVVIVDDFAVPGDPGYGFDDYGPGKRLILDELPPDLLSDHVALFPALPSADEGGLRRGCVVIVSPARAEALLADGVSLRRPEA